MTAHRLLITEIKQFNAYYSFIMDRVKIQNEASQSDDKLSQEEIG